MADGASNTPKLTKVRPPFDPDHPPTSIFKLLASYPATLRYFSKAGLFLIPGSIDRWRYRDLLQALDGICLRVLHSKGALSAEELVEWINRNSLNRNSLNCKT